MSNDTEFLAIIGGIRVDESVDPISLASRDFRIERMTRYILLGEGDDADMGNRFNYHVLVSQIGGDYDLSLGDVSVALQISEDRLLRTING